MDSGDQRGYAIERCFVAPFEGFPQLDDGYEVEEEEEGSEVQRSRRNTM